MRVLVLGCGPAGLMAAHAAALAGHDVLIYSKARKSRLYGCQYLHAPIPGISEDQPVDVSYHLDGTPEDYRRKVYGPTWKGKVSPETLDADHHAWDIRAAYDRLWDMYGSYVQDIDLQNPEALEGVLHSGQDVTFSTVPAPLLCADPGHDFGFETVYALGDAPEEGQYVPFRPAQNYGEHAVVCNGLDVPSWYRLATVHGYTTVEWPGSKKPPVAGVAEVTKPLATDCTCLPDVHRLGRYGAWRKGVLSHEAFFEATIVLGNYSLGIQDTLEGL
jgi:hypothetical protein